MAPTPGLSHRIGEMFPQEHEGRVSSPHCLMECNVLRAATTCGTRAMCQGAQLTVFFGNFHSSHITLGG